METCISFKVLNEYLNYCLQISTLCRTRSAFKIAWLMFLLCSFCLFVFFFLQYRGVRDWGGTQNKQRGLGNEHGERENEKWEPSIELEMKLLIGLGFELGFFPFFIFLFPILVTSSLGPVNAFQRVQASTKFCDEFKWHLHYGKPQMLTSKFAE